MILSSDGHACATSAAAGLDEVGGAARAAHQLVADVSTDPRRLQPARPLAAASGVTASPPTFSFVPREVMGSSFARSRSPAMTSALSSSPPSRTGTSLTSS